MDRLDEGVSSESLLFLDAQHVLVTYEQKGLFQRQPNCPPWHQDRMVHAMVLDLTTKAVVKEADWYLHDRKRYLWPFGANRILLRKLNDLYVVDAELHEKLLWSSPKDLLWVSVTPDVSQIIVETTADTKPGADKDSSPASVETKAPPAAPADPKYVAQFLDAKTLKPERMVPLHRLVELTGTKWGYVDLVDGKDNVWLIRFGPNPQQRKNITRVRSVTMPSVLYSSDNSLVVGRCAGPTCQYPVSSFSLTGRRLWRQNWPEYRWFPAVGYDDDESRFAISALRINHDALPPKTSASGQENPYQTDLSQVDAFQQQVQIFDTATGDILSKVSVEPAVMSGQNFAIAPDGGSLAVLQHTSLELFALPSPSKAQQSEFAILKADIPTVYAVASSPEAVAGSTDATGATIADLSNASSNQPPAATSAVSSTSPVPMALQEPGGSGEPATTIKVTSRAVIVDVVVTDSKGHPVHGLPQKDFHVSEDSTPQEVRYFHEVSNTSFQKKATAASTANSVPKSADSPAEEPAKPALSANTFSNESKAPEPGAVTLILFDVLNTPPQDQVFAREQLLKFLTSKPANLQIGLCTLSAGGSHLRMVQGFTADENLLMAAAKGSKIKQAVSGYQGSQTSTSNDIDTVSQLASASISNGFQGLLSALQTMQSEEQSMNTDQRVAVTVNSFMMLSRYLAALPGRKNVVWLSGSFPISIPSSYAGEDPSLSNRDYSRAVKTMTNLLAEAQIAVYPVDARGNQGFTTFSAENLTGINTTAYHGPQDLNGSNLATPQSEVPGDQALATFAAERASLSQVAQATGGKAFFNTNGIGQAIATAVEEGSNYYTLSYTPSNTNYDGKFRKIKVGLEDKGYKLHYRQGYFAVSASADDLEAARLARIVAMQHASPPSRQLLFSSEVIPVGPKKKVERAELGQILLGPSKAPLLPARVEAQHLSVDYSFKAANLSFTSSENSSYRNSLMLMVGSYDQNGRMISANSALAVTDLKASDYQQVLGGNVTLHQDLDIPANANWLRLGIQDQISNKIGTVEFSLPLPVPPGMPRKATEILPEIEPD